MHKRRFTPFITPGFLFTCLVFLTVMALIGMSFQQVQASGEPMLQAAKIMNLCGRLEFIEVLDGSVTLLGLLPCGETKPYIFDQRPAELLKYYRITNAEVKSGAKTNTKRYGNLTKYITGWDSYIGLNSCSECSTGPSATKTYTPEASPTSGTTLGGSPIPPSGQPGGTALYHPVGKQFPMTLAFAVNPGQFSTTNGHSGIDYAVPTGTPVIAPNNCKVLDVGEDMSGNGLYVLVEQGDGSRLLFAHLSEVKVSEGQDLTAGATIALSGNSGKSSGPHLHVEYRLANAPVDPSPLFPLP